ncbi:odorant receptor 13a [Diachasma alloeum]|uniref:Odorant receptor n=1 Tax=Diachasma alloeum TaxID=454923 RepID=A0A4E0RN19_9HYME|nr:odorant receptor 13a [Diachasma alloeum]THK33178.1 odorant receptor 155 [Diachasma alloeum]
MDFWDQPYYWLTKTVLRAIGHWPFQARRERIICRIILHFIYWIQVIPEVIVVVRHFDDADLVMETVSSFLIDIGAIANICTFIVYSDKIRNLLEEIKQNWKIFPKHNGLQLLHQYSQSGRTRSIVYSAYLWAAWSVFVSEPVHFRLVRLFIPSNKTLPMRFAIPVDYGPLDVEKHYYTILVVAAISIFAIVTLIIAADLLLFLYAHHACGLLAALGLAIENLPVDATSPRKATDDEYQYMKNCIVLHSRTIRFSDTVEEIFCWNFFMTIGLNMIVISMTAFQVVTNLNTLPRLFKTLVFAVASVMHLFIQCFMSQQIIDLSLAIEQSLMNAKWYHATRRTKQLMQFMMVRSHFPCQLTAGRMMLMSLDTFSSVIRTSVSYFMVFMDMQ